ncbi:unnamed protein product [Lupinus luteus]|uniref:DM2 domain-containing protein n=1 Tax=Lupinus luteus TaxID=3873 RepID=A0AAV1VUS0_LUPLU
MTQIKSILMKKKLEETGKSCLYRNYDLLPTKIMGLNPPFGLKAALANKFIDKALEFKPKLLILIVPQETERLDKKRSPYDLVWEDNRFLSGKSFYLPGSVDTNDKQMEQWNVRPPPLSLWSHPDWIDAHKAIAQKHGHLLSQRETLQMESLNNERLPASDAMGDVDNLSLGNDLKSKKDQASMNEGQKVSSFLGNVGRHSQERQECGMSKAESTSRKRKQTEERDRREPGVTLPARRQVVNQIPESPSNPINGRSSAEGFQPKSVMSPYFDVGDHGHGHLGPISSSDVEFGAAYRETRNWPSVANPLSGIEEHHGSLRGDSTGSRGYRNDGGQYLSELETSQWTPHYGHQDHPHSISAMRNNFLSGHDAAHNHMRPSYGGFGSVSDSYMMNTSYAAICTTLG